MKKFKYTEQVRKDVWDKLTECEFTIKSLKGIVQNEMEVTEDDRRKWIAMKENLVKTLDKIQLKLEIEADKEMN